MRGLMFFQKPCYREIRAMRGRVMRRPPVVPYDYHVTPPKLCTNIFAIDVITTQIIVVGRHQQSYCNFLI